MKKWKFFVLISILVLYLPFLVAAGNFSNSFIDEIRTNQNVPNSSSLNCTNCTTLCQYCPIWDGDHSQPDPYLVYEYHKKVLEATLKAQGKTPQQIQNSISSLQPPPAQRGMPTNGTVRIPVFLVDFSDAPHDPNQTVADVQSKMFGNGNSSDYPYESLKNYYQRSSYNQLNVTGDVYGWYRAAYPRSYYMSFGRPQGYEVLTNEILQYYDTTVNFANYDSDHNGKMDGLLIKWAGSDTGWTTFWWACQPTMYTPITVDGVTPYKYVWSWYSNTNQGYPDNYYHPQTDIHETGHLLGLPDYYDYDANIGPKGGVGGWDMMDSNWGDHNAFSKYLLGWIDPIVIGSGIHQIILPPSGTTSSDNAVMIMPNAVPDSFGEFFLVQYREPGEGNDPLTGGWWGSLKKAVWIWHVDATLTSNGQSFQYDNSYTNHKLLRLMEGDSREQIQTGSSYFDYFDFYYPGRFFGSKTVPNSQNYQGYGTNVSIYDLKQLPSGMQAHFSLNDVPPERISLGEALDSPVLPWITDNSNHMWNWSGQNGTFIFGDSAAQSGPISNNEWTGLATIVEGPGNLSFYWKVSSEINYDKLRVYVDGIEQANISGDQDWIKQNFSLLSDGVHTIIWYYTKDSIVDYGADAGWVDKFEWIPAIVPVASFTPNVTSGTAPLAVQFNETSTNSPTAWNWSFRNVTGNNTQVWFSTAQTPAHTFGEGNYSIVLNASNNVGYNLSTQTTFINVTAAPVFPDANATSQIGVFRPATGIWYLDTTNTGVVNKSFQFGKFGDVAVTGDWDGNGVTDVGVFRPSTGTWYLDTTKTGVVNKSFQFGKSGDIPVVGDWNGKGTSDAGVFRPATGTWYLDTTKTGVISSIFQFGKSGDSIVRGDWDGNGITDVGVFRPSTGTWYLDTTKTGVVNKSFQFGKSGDIPVVGDWNGKGTSDAGVFRPATGTWYLDTTKTGVISSTFQFGKSGDSIVRGDWDGNGISDIGVFRPATGTWYLDTAKTGVVNKSFQFGKSGDIPVVGEWTVPSVCSQTTIHMRNNSFDPKVLTALPGTGIYWINDDDIVHSISMSGPDAMFISGDIIPDALYGYTFRVQEGIFTISSFDHPDMKGTVIIKTPCLVY